MTSDEHRTGERGDATVIGLTVADRLLLWLGAPALGLVLGLVLPWVAGWTADREWAPWRGLFRAIASFDGPVAVVVYLAAGLALGLGFAFIAVVGSLKATVTDEQIRLDKDGKTRVIARHQVGAVFTEGRKLVVLDPESRQLARETHEGRGADVGRAFRSHGYPWREGDPHADLYRRWVPDTPDLPPGVNAVLKARQKALKDRDARDIAELRDEVQRLGFVVRDDAARQYWRPLVRD